MADIHKSTENVADGKANIDQADKLYSLVVSMITDWNSVNDVKAEIIKEYATDAIALFGKTNQEKKVELRRVAEKCEEIISPESFDSLKKRAEKALLRIVYPRNPALRNILFVSILSITFLSILIPALLNNLGRTPQTNNARASELIVNRDQLGTDSLRLAREISKLEIERARMQADPESTDAAKQAKDVEIGQKKEELAAINHQITFIDGELKNLNSR